jgi:transposase-like protein
MACLVCDHPKRYRIEVALREGTAKTRVASQFGINRATLYDHIKKKHEQKSPAKEPEGSSEDDDIVDPFPNDHTVRGFKSRGERLRHVERMIEDRRFDGSESLAKLARMWRDQLGNNAPIQVAELFAEALKRQTLARGSKDLRRKFAMAELLSMYRRCRDSGDYKTAASLFGQYIELDGLKHDSTLDRAVLVHIVHLIRHEAPHLERRVEEHLAQFEIVVDQAKAVLEGETTLLPEPEANPTPNNFDPGIDTRIENVDEEPSSE